jgi:hypothetical protein
MANPTKSEYLGILAGKFNDITSNSGILTDAELVAMFNAQLEVAKTVSPTKGGVKAIYEN